MHGRLIAYKPEFSFAITTNLNNSSFIYDPFHAERVLITYAKSKGSDEPMYMRSSASASTICMNKIT